MCKTQNCEKSTTYKHGYCKDCRKEQLKSATKSCKTEGCEGTTTYKHGFCKDCRKEQLKNMTKTCKTEGCEGTTRFKHGLCKDCKSPRKSPKKVSPKKYNNREIVKTFDKNDVEIIEHDVVDNDYKETFTFTFGEQAENHAGMQILGGGLADKGFDITDINAAIEKIKTTDTTNSIKIQLVALHEYGKKARPDLEFEEAYILIIRNGLDMLLGDFTKDDLLKEQEALTWDTKALMRGRVVNKHARSNLCYGETKQVANIAEGKGTIVPFLELPVTKAMHSNLHKVFGEKAKNMQLEGNRYFDLDKCKIGWHGDGERKRVIAVRLGASFQFAYQWYYNNDTIGPRISTIMNHGDVYIMSEKASGWDWKRSSIPTLRHAAGNDKNLVVIPRLTKLVKKGNVELIKKLIENGMNPNNSAGDKNNLPIVEAVKRGKLDVVKMLVEGGAKHDLEEFGIDLTEISKKKGYNEMTEYLKSL